MKRLAVFCDGTWNDLRMPARTNVARLAKCVDETGAGAVRQVVYYDAGVGVPSGVGRFADWLIGVSGGAFGRGLDEKIEAAYRFLVLNYEPGDEIYVFGFSRGAYTARSLCGLIRKCGIVRRDCFDVIPQAVDLYRNDTRPERVRDFRERFAHHFGGRLVATGREDLGADREAMWGGRHGPSHLRADDHHIYKLMYLGLWDTVGALGVPARFKTLAKLFNARYRFHDTDASSLISHLRHAVAINEDRYVFDVTPVSNIEPLNRDWAGAMGRELEDPKHPDFAPYRERPYQQRWFPGDHGAVGGGNPEPGLSSGALLWIAEGAEQAGLKLRRGSGTELAEAERLQAPLANWRIRKDRSARGAWEFDGLGMIGGYRDRHGPATRDEVHESAQHRLVQSPPYRPRPLERFTGQVWPTPRYRIAAGLAFPLFMLLLIAVAAVLVGLAWLMLKGFAEEAAEAWRWGQARWRAG